MEHRELYVMVSAYFPTIECAWRYSFVYDLVCAIVATGRYRVIVVNPKHEGNYIFRGIEVIGFQEISSGRWVAPRVINKINQLRMLAAIRKYGINLEEISIVHGQLIASAVYLEGLKRLNKDIKTILQFQDPDPYGMLFGNGFLGWIKKVRYFLYHRSLAEHVDILVGISKNVTRVIHEAPRQTVYNFYPPMAKAMRVLKFFRPARLEGKLIYTLHNSVNRSIFSGGEKERKTNDVFTIGCVAVFRDWKDQITLLEAVNSLRKIIPAVKLKLVGVHHSGSMLEDCQKYIQSNEMDVEIIPSIDHKELGGFYRSIDLFVLPSYFEGFGCVFTEAWNCGTPFITCEGQAMDDLIYPEERHLWLCKIHDYKDLASKILYFYKNRPKQQLQCETDINITVSAFLNEVENFYKSRD